MNHSIYSADRGTHLKILLIALVGATVVGVLGSSIDTSKTAAIERNVVLKAGRPMAVSSASISLAR